MRARRAAATGSASRPQIPSGELNIFADPDSPPKRGDPRRVRRNSESSLAGNGKPLDPEEEKKRQERRRRERRHREARDGKGPKKPERKLDIIDKLDVTSIYGTGCKHAPCCTLLRTDFQSQYSIMTDHSMHATLIEIDKEASVLR